MKLGQMRSGTLSPGISILNPHAVGIIHPVSLLSGRSGVVFHSGHPPRGLCKATASAFAIHLPIDFVQTVQVLVLRQHLGLNQCRREVSAAPRSQICSEPISRKVGSWTAARRPSHIRIPPADGRWTAATGRGVGTGSLCSGVVILGNATSAEVKTQRPAGSFSRWSLVTATVAGRRCYQFSSSLKSRNGRKVMI